MGHSIREATADDWPAIWVLLEPVFRAGETYTYPRDIAAEQARHAWMTPPAKTFVCEDAGGTVVGTYYLKPNQPGQGGHVCNCGYVVSPAARGYVAAYVMFKHLVAA